LAEARQIRVPIHTSKEDPKRLDAESRIAVKTDAAEQFQASNTQGA